MNGDTQEALWEYEYTDSNTGTTRHGIDYAEIVDGGQYGFALNWVTDESDWAVLQPIFRYMESSFVPPGD
jgi:hypothetical protein